MYSIYRVLITIYGQRVAGLGEVAIRQFDYNHNYD